MKFDKPIALAADHGGYELKEAIKAHLDELGVACTDFGTDSTASVDYPDFAAKGCKAVQDGSCALVILCCGTGVGMSMCANNHEYSIVFFYCSSGVRRVTFALAAVSCPIAG